MTYLLALLLAAAAIALIVYLVSLPAKALDFDPRDLWVRWRVERYFARAREGDRALQVGDLPSALREYRLALYPYLCNDAATASMVANHHTGVLSRLIAAADQLQGGTVRLFSLARVDRLFDERRQLQKKYLQLRQQKKIEQMQTVQREFRTNTEELRTALAKLAEEITAAREQVRYH